MCLLVTCLLFGTLQAQDTQSYLTVSGVVQDKQNNTKLGNVTVSFVGTNISTVTNDDGDFVLKSKASSRIKYVEFSLIGYQTLRVEAKEENMLDQKFYLTPNESNLKEALVLSWKDPRQLVEAALDKLGDNYSNSPTLLTGFYRETAKKRRTYVNVAEAVINVYKTAYRNEGGVESDRVELYKGRKLLSQKAKDTLVVKLSGGPNLALYVDFVKNPEVLFDKEHLSDYKFEMSKREFIDGRPQLVVHFEPQIIQPYQLYYGNVYIDEATLAFTRAEFSLDMKDRGKAISAILVQKPQGLRFSPESLTFLVTYKQQDGKTYLNYIRNEIKFKCDWKKKLFATNYTITSEMVVTDRQDQNVSSISRKDSFRDKEVLSDKVGAFYDEGFWENYNIIEPTESLESAISKLKKQYK